MSTLLGVTGSIATGKSTLGKMLNEMGVPVHDSDAAVRDALTHDKEVIELVLFNFPKARHFKNRKDIDRHKLREIIFADPQKRKTLEEILHPKVWEAQADFIHAHKHHEMLALDIPLLFETGAEKRVDYTLCTACPPFLQKKRALARPGMTEALYHDILASQMPTAEKAARADYVIQTGLGIAHTYKQLRGVMDDIRAPKKQEEKQEEEIACERLF